MSHFFMNKRHGILVKQTSVPSRKCDELSVSARVEPLCDLFAAHHLSPGFRASTERGTGWNSVDMEKRGSVARPTSSASFRGSSSPVPIELCFNRETW